MKLLTRQATVKFASRRPHFMSVREFVLNSKPISDKRPGSELLLFASLTKTITTERYDHSHFKQTAWIFRT
ncbi:hypothetical protein BSPA111_24060 [Buttiauxella sp. A111]|nr:hypothetical protein BSPA111_24060 [Buttiauxella sp. A111]